METYVTAYNSHLPAAFTNVVASDIKALSFVSGELVPNTGSEFFPGRSDEKIMRQDVKTAIVAVSEMLAGRLTEEQRDDTDLYVANGVFIEDTGKHMERIVTVYKQIDSSGSEMEKMQKLYQSTPPLLALQTLTNSTMSFIAQYAGIRGNNATFGNTSQSGFFAIEKAVSSMLYKNAGRSVVCASNCGGIFSYLTFSSFFTDVNNWKESGASVCLLFEKGGSADKSLCKITRMKSQNRASLDMGKPEKHWKDLRDDHDADHTIFSGAFTQTEYQSDETYCRSFAKNLFSYYEQLGNLGAANVPMSVIKAIELLKAGRAKIDIFDRDAYGRESYIRIEK